MEINNEPHHTGPKQKVTEYVNRMVRAVRSTRWTKPVFYNISESFTHADAVAVADIQGVSFQWYPTGLVANRELKGNYLPHVDQYRIPFKDTIPAFANKAKMVYEFDAGDVYQSYMYPAMARSFRQAGFQWATQFAYDPMATAYANTEYQTHYLNLAYTPSKAISLLIASKVFHNLPRNKHYGTYPEDTVFDNFRLSYHEDLCEMTSDKEFYYSNSTTSHPENASTLQHIAGVGNSPIVKYEGTGAYFLDKRAPGEWRLEVMPDAIRVNDPFAKASLKKVVTAINYRSNKMFVSIPDLSSGFEIVDLNNKVINTPKYINGEFKIFPGTYLLRTKKWASSGIGPINLKNIGVKEFVAPETTKGIFIHYEPLTDASSGQVLNVSFMAAGLDSLATAKLEIRNSAGKWKTVDFSKISPYKFVATIPADMMMPGIINYRLFISNAGKQLTYPGGHVGDPYAWDNFNTETYEIFVAAKASMLEIFNPNSDRSQINILNPDWRNNSIEYVAGSKPRQLMLRMNAKSLKSNEILGWQFYFADKIKGRQSEVTDIDHLVIRARSNNKKQNVQVILLSDHHEAYSTLIELNDQLTDYAIALNKLTPVSAVLLPRPYPSFQTMWFRPATITETKINVSNIEKIQVMIIGNAESGNTEALTVEIESIGLRND